jgi:hypothetical protein
LAKSTSAPAQRDELAAAQARECGGEEDRRVLLVRCGVHHGEHLLGRVELQLAAGGVDLTGLLDVADRVDRQPVALACALDDAEQHGQDLDLRRVAHVQRELPVLDHVGREVLDRQVAEGRHEVRLDDRAVVAQRRRLQAPVGLLVGEVVRAGGGEAHASLRHSGQRAVALRERPGGGAAALRRCRTDRLVDALRPSGRRYSARHTGPRRPSNRTRKPCNSRPFVMPEEGLEPPTRGL